MNEKRLERRINSLNKKIDRLYDKLPKAKGHEKRLRIRRSIVMHEDIVKYYRAYLDLMKRINEV